MKQQDIIIVFVVILAILFLCHTRSTYQIIVPNEHEIGTNDDEITLVGGKPTSPLMTESVTYDFIDTLAKLKGAHSASEVLMFDFGGKTIQEVTDIMSTMNVDQFIATLQSMGYHVSTEDPFHKELAINKAHPVASKKIDCTKCKWKSYVDKDDANNSLVDANVKKQCVYQENGVTTDCNPGLCRNINGTDPWPDVGPNWKPSSELERSWECKGGKAITNPERCAKYIYDKDNNPTCTHWTRDYNDYVLSTPVLNN